MVGTLGSQLGLFAFAVALGAGALAGNSIVLTLTRALLALGAGMLVGQFAGWTAKQVLREHLVKRKLEIDQQHFAQMRAMTDNGQLPDNAAEPDPAHPVG